MKEKEIIALVKKSFPLEIEVTMDILKSSIYGNRNNCIAATALKSKIPNDLHDLIDWGTGIGRIQGVPIRSIYYNNQEKQWFDHYLQFANTKEGDIVKFIIDEKR